MVLTIFSEHHTKALYPTQGWMPCIFKMPTLDLLQCVYAPMTLFDFYMGSLIFDLRELYWHWFRMLVHSTRGEWTPPIYTANTHLFGEGVGFQIEEINTDQQRNMSPNRLCSTKRSSQLRFLVDALLWNYLSNFVDSSLLIFINKHSGGDMCSQAEFSSLRIHKVGRV